MDRTLRRSGSKRGLKHIGADQRKYGAEPRGEGALGLQLRASHEPLDSSPPQAFLGPSPLCESQGVGRFYPAAQSLAVHRGFTRLSLVEKPGESQSHRGTKAAFSQQGNCDFSLEAFPKPSMDLPMGNRGSFPWLDGLYR